MLEDYRNLITMNPMKTLLILRHAKASKGDPNLKDHERPLNEIGQVQIPSVAKMLTKEGLKPDLILSSTALRTRQTAELMAKVIGFSGKFIYTDELYESNMKKYFEALQDLPDESQTVMIVGHNPAHEEFLSLLTDKFESLSTGALAYVELSTNHWRELQMKPCGKLIHLWRPKEMV